MGDITKLKEQVKKVRLQEKLAKQGFHYDAKELFNQLQNQLQKQVQNDLRRYSTPKAIEEPKEWSAIAELQNYWIEMVYLLKLWYTLSKSSSTAKKSYSIVW